MRLARNVSRSMFVSVCSVQMTETHQLSLLFAFLQLSHKFAEQHACFYLNKAVPVLCISNKKQCSRQLQCKVPCSVGNVINFSLFIHSSLSSLSSTSHAIHGGGVQVWGGGGGGGGGLGGGGEGRGHFHPAAMYCTTTWCVSL